MAERSGEVAARTPTVLVVDGDRVSRRFVELSLRGLVVESATNADAAMEVLRTQVIDLVISETMLPEMNGLRFLRRLREESRMQSIPFVFLSSDTRVDTKVLALRAGVDDYLTKPCDANELAARVQSLLERAIRSRREGWNRTYTLAGDFSSMSFPDLVASIDMGHRSGVLSVLSANVGGQVFFERGRAVHARFGNLTGAEAFYRFVWQSDGQFEFRTGPLELSQQERTLTQSTTALIMEAARISDTLSYRDEDDGRPSGSDRLPTPMLPCERLVAGPIADTTLAAQYEMAIRDPFALGDLKILSQDGLAQWTLGAVGRDRLHIVLIASLTEAVSAMLPLAGAPTERSIVDSLAPGRKALALAFFLRDERLLDLVLIDAREPGIFSASLRRVPSILMLAPPGGDFMALGTESCAVLTSLIDSLDPVAIMGIGLPTLASGMTRMGIVSTNSRVVRCLHAVLGDPTCDFRHVLVQGLRLWTFGSKTHSTRPSRRSPP